MNETAPLPHEPDSNQARASDPVASAWVSANAGTGKTTVLVRRCLRLLLADSQPEAILCLTYTKTAAAQMQNKLLEALSAWAILPEDKLSADVENLRSFEREYRSRLKSYFQQQLSALDGNGEGGSLSSSDHAPKRLKSLLGEESGSQSQHG